MSSFRIPCTTVLVGNKMNDFYNSTVSLIYFYYTGRMESVSPNLLYLVKECFDYTALSFALLILCYS